MSRRTERVASLIRQILADAIRSLNDPRIPTVTSITRVEVSEDFATAKVHVSALAPDKRRALCLTALRSAAGHLRWLLGQELTLRKLPQLEFRLDDSVRRGIETVETIERVMRELGEVPEWERAPAAGEAPAADEVPGHPDGAGEQEDR